MAHLKKEQETTAIGAKEKTRRAKKEKLAGFVFQTQSHSWQHLNLSLPKEGHEERGESGSKSKKGQIVLRLVH